MLNIQIYIGSRWGQNINPTIHIVYILDDKNISNLNIIIHYVSLLTRLLNSQHTFSL